jgi:AcrR family transcriptional regulator
MSQLPPEAPPEGRRERRKRELRERIFRVARDLFLAHGIEATTVEQIAEAADIAPATFFNHFHNKQAVVQEMALGVLEGYWVSLEEQRKRPAPAREWLHAFAQQASDFIRRTPDLMRAVLLELMRSKLHDAGDGPRIATTYELFAAILADGQTAGDVRSDFDASFLAGVAADVFHGMVAHWLEDPTFPLDDRMREAADFLGQSFEAPPTR